MKYVPNIFRHGYSFYNVPTNQYQSKKYPVEHPIIKIRKDDARQKSVAIPLTITVVLFSGRHVFTKSVIKLRRFVKDIFIITFQSGLQDSNADQLRVSHGTVIA